MVIKISQLADFSKNVHRTLNVGVFASRRHVSPKVIINILKRNKQLISTPNLKSIEYVGLVLVEYHKCFIFTS